MADHANIIFEGNQGILLDKDHGFYPYVTYSKTTNYNIKDHLKTFQWVSRWYVTRAYLTRHGAGPLPDEQNIELINNAEESNHTNLYQGKFRTAPLNLELIKYAIQCDFTDCNLNGETSVVVTCIDQIDSNKVIEALKEQHRSLYVNHSPESKTIEKITNTWKFS